MVNLTSLRTAKFAVRLVCTKVENYGQYFISDYGDEYSNESTEHRRRRTFNPMLGRFTNFEKRIQSLEDFLKTNDDFFASMGMDSDLQQGLPLGLKRNYDNYEK